MRNINRKGVLKVFFIILFFIIFSAGFSSASLNITIKGVFESENASFSSDFIALSQTGAVTGLEGYDFLSPVLGDGEAGFYSVIPGNLYLGVDAWDSESVKLRNMNLVFRTNPSSNGKFKASWKFSNLYYDAYITYYGNDSKRSNNLTGRINMESVSEFSDENLLGEAYFLLEVIYYSPSVPIGENKSTLDIDPLYAVKCNETLICSSWEVCQNLEFSFNGGDVAEGDYLAFKKECNSKGYDSQICGYQSRACQVDEECVNNLIVPLQSQACYYVLNPSCTDNIKNCHNGKCEVLADCGGPCTPCPTCFDGLKNQGEKKVDCEGPCFNVCDKNFIDRISEIEGKKILLAVIYGLFVIIVSGAILFLIYYIKKVRKRLSVDQYSWYNLK